MLPKASRLLAALCLLILLQHATAQSFQVIRRQDDGPSSIATTGTSEDEPQETNVDGKDMKEEDDNKEEKNDDDEEEDKKDGKEDDKKNGDDEGKAEKSASESEKQTSSPTTALAVTTSTTLTGDQELDDSKFENATIPEGQLPLEPKVTPGYGVAGAVLLITGIAYTLIGTKNRWLHTFFSSAYLAALGITVLIVYLMKVPVSDGLQGGYVAATIFPACLVGGASIFFKELTEGLGCALGGFSISMWLLCLVPGGLVKSSAGTAIFIACFTVGGFAFYPSRYTRDWALIFLMSFAGATVTVLGIDCFSRAGLKEFWAYVWNLNDDLFPLGATTYPVTKGIRVETAAVIILCLFGIISQIKLWRIVREKRAQREAARVAEQQDLERQEMDVGAAVEEANARERRRWERVHGDGEIMSSRDSQQSNGDLEKGSMSEKRGTKGSDVEVIEMSDLSGSEAGRAPDALMEEQDKDGKITIRVAEDDTRPANREGEDVLDEKVGLGLSSGQVTPATTAAEHRLSNVPSEAPDVIPLPFSVPQPDAASQDDRSSVATFADDENTAAPISQRQSMVKRLSTSSGKLLRSFSQRSAGSGVAGGRVGNGSDEDLVIPKAGHDGDNESLVATVDDSVDSDDRRLSDATGLGNKSIEITAELSDRSPVLPGYEPSQASFSPNLSGGVTKQSARKSTDTLQVPRSPALDSAAGRSDGGKQSLEAESPAPKSIASAVSATPVNLTKDHLPKSLSRVALSYRTNEWAKHLSLAETPAPEKLDIQMKRTSTKPTKEQAEASAPVNVAELQKTAEDGIPAAKIRKSTSKESVGSVSRSASQVSNRRSFTEPVQEPNVLGEGLPMAKRRSSQNTPGLRLSRSSSANGLKRLSNFDTIEEEKIAPRSPAILEEGDAEDTDEAMATGQTSPTGPIPTSSSAPGIVSYDSPQTLLGQREMFLRNRSQGNLLASPSDQNLISSNSNYSNTAPASDAGSLYNYPAYVTALGADADDVPLSQRKEFMRQSSMMSLTGHGAAPSPQPQWRPESTQPTTSVKIVQPWRVSNVPTQTEREARLANFRSSVAQDLRSGTPVAAHSGRSTPFASTQNLLAGTPVQDVDRNIELQRNAMLGQREAEGQRREMENQRKLWANQVFDEKMRSGEMLGAHREAMRKMQKGAKE